MADTRRYEKQSFELLVVVLLFAIGVLLIRITADLDHIRRQQCYTPVVERGQRVLLYADGCR